MDFHEYAGIFPLLEGREFAELCNDIKANGQREPIWVYEGKILDGRNRFRACNAVGVTPRTAPYAGDDPLAFVLSLNLHRRHLSESQRGMVAAKIANMPAHRPALNPANLPPSLEGMKPDQQPAFTSQASAAEMLNVSERTVRAAVKVRNEAAPELVRAVESGKVSVSAAADVATLPKEEQAVIVARGEREILEAAKQIRAEKADVKRAERVQKIAEISQGNTALDLAKKYPVIYCDPPWRYDYAATESRAIENQYPTMALDEICALPVSEIAHSDCVLFMWTTSPKLEESMQVIAAWGFTYKTCAVWDKQKIGMGYYFRQRHELLLVATKGAPPAPLPSARPDSVFSFPRGEHSSKPQEVAQLIEAMYPDFEKIEMFCRAPRHGWAVWGNQSAAHIQKIA